MTRVRDSLRAPLLAVALVALVGVVAIPALAASPTPGGGPSASGKPDKEPKGPKASREPEVTVTLNGTIATTKNAEGETSYTLTAGGKTLKLEAGPSWFFGDKHPLAPFVGKTVTITGEQSGDGVDVLTVDGTALRAPGKPPWAGGWKAVGSIHPGWSQEKADRWSAKQGAKGGAADAAAATGCWPPGHCKDKGEAPTASGRTEGP